MLTGRGRYVSDWNLPGQAYGHFLRSDRAHAKIVSIQTAEALKSPGVIAVITGQELVGAGLKPIPAAAPFKWKDGSAQRQEDGVWRTDAARRGRQQHGCDEKGDEPFQVRHVVARQRYTVAGLGTP